MSNYSVRIVKRSKKIVISGETETSLSQNLFFLNLGGYKEEEFDEFHYKLLAVADSSGDAIKQAKQTAFYKHVGFKGASSHIDDKYGIDIDDVSTVKEILQDHFKELYSIELKEEKQKEEDKMHLGYLPIKNIR